MSWTIATHSWSIGFAAAGLIALPAQLLARPSVGTGLGVVLLFALAVTSAHSTTETLAFLFVPLMGLLACRAARARHLESGKVIAIACVPVVQLLVMMENWVMVVLALGMLAAISSVRRPLPISLVVGLATAPTVLVSVLLMAGVLPRANTSAKLAASDELLEAPRHRLAWGPSATTLGGILAVELSVRYVSPSPVLT